MNIYDDNGELDFDAAARELDATKHITDNAGLKQRQRIATIQTAALLDIGMSLRILAAEAGAAMGLGEPTVEAEPEPVDEIARDFLVVGDLVHLIGSTDPGEVVKLGSDGGDPWAEVDFATAKGVRYYWRNLERLVGDADTGAPFNPALAAALNAEADGEPDLPAVTTLAEIRTSDVPLAGVATEAEAEVLQSDADEDGEEAVGGYELDAAEDDEPTPEVDESVTTAVLGAEDTIDDIDADFDGDAHTAAEQALERLRANEEKRKAAKKTTKKGSKK